MLNNIKHSIYFTIGFIGICLFFSMQSCNTNRDGNIVILPTKDTLENRILSIEKQHKVIFTQKFGFDIYFEDTMFNIARCEFKNKVRFEEEISLDKIQELKERQLASIIFYEISSEYLDIYEYLKKSYPEYKFEESNIPEELEPNEIEKVKVYDSNKKLKIVLTHYLLTKHSTVRFYF